MKNIFNISKLLIIKDLAVNAFVLISFLFIGGQIFKDEKYSLTPISPVRIRLLCGIIAGVLGGTLMFFGMNVNQIVVIDFRYFAIIIAAIYGGAFSSTVAGLIIVIFRMLLFGINKQSMVMSTAIVLISVGCGFISKLSIHKKKKWLYMIAFSCISFLMGILLLLTDKTIFYEVFLIYLISTIILGIMLYYLTEYINKSNLLIRRLKEASSKDFLTGLNNVREFDSLFNDLSQKAIKKKEKLSLIFIDIDFFKKINDTYGHSAGDAVLSELGILLNITCRSFDIISRNGGEEFSVLLIDCPGEQALEVGERIRKAVENHEFVLPAGEKINITISVGAATYPDTTGYIEKLMENADTALYAAKRSGRNKVLLYSYCYS